MAIDGYEKYIQAIKDEPVKTELQNIQKDHKQHAIRIAERIQNLDGKTSDGVGLMGQMAQVVSNIKDIGKNDTVSILRLAYKGEDNGIKMAQEIVKGDLDNESYQMIQDILNDDCNHLTILDNLIKQ